jgi:hypothetical protein
MMTTFKSRDNKKDRYQFVIQDIVEPRISFCFLRPIWNYYRH